MKKNMQSISILLALMLLVTGICTIPTVAAADTRYSVTSAVGATGETVTVSVSLSTSVDLWGANVSLNYNPAELEVLDYNQGSAAASASLNNTGSSVNFSGMFAAKSGTIFTVRFKILAESGESALTLSSSENTDNDGTTHSYSVSNGSITVVNRIPVEKIALDKTSITMKKGDTSKLNASVSPSNTTENTVSFYSSDDDIVSVSEDGTVKALKGGTASITAIAGGKSAKCKVVVTVAQTGIRASGNTSRNAIVGEKISLSVINVPADTTDNFTAKWTTSNPSVATVSGNGVVTAVAPGEAIVTAKVNSWSVTYKIVVALNEDESTTAESTTEESTVEESTSEESTSDLIVTEPTTPPYTLPTTDEEFSLIEPATNENIDENNANGKEYSFYLILASVGVLTVVIGAVAFFVVKGYYSKNKKQKIIVEEKKR